MSIAIINKIQKIKKTKRKFKRELKKLSQNNIDDFYEIISKRYENGSIIVTSNKKFDEWGKIFYDPVLATAILDRFIHHCNFVVIDGESYRMKQRQEKLNGL